MDRIELPFVPSGTSIKDALTILAAKKVSALVTRIDGEETVLKAADLLEPGSTALATLEQVPPSRKTGVLPPNPLKDQAVTETALDAQGAQFGVANWGGDLAQVVTRYETIAQELRAMPHYFMCKGPRQHLYSGGSVPGDRVCSYDGADIEEIIVS